MANSSNLSVVLTELPDGATLSQISKFCRKVGVLATHPETGEDLILFNPKSRKATVTYNYPDGANHAIELLCDECFSADHRVKVERAPREPFDFSQWKGALRQQRKFHSYLGDYEEEPKSAEQKRMKIMILRNVFEPKELVKDPELYGKIIKDWTETCSKFGKVTLVKPIEAHPEGVVIVRFDEPQAAAVAIGELDDAEYRSHTISTEPWDGTDLSAKESEETIQARIEEYEKYIEKELQ